MLYSQACCFIYTYMYGYYEAVTMEWMITFSLSYVQDKLYPPLHDMQSPPNSCLINNIILPYTKVNIT